MKKILLFLPAFFMITELLYSQNYRLPLWNDNIPNFRASGETEKRDTSEIVTISKVQTPEIEVYLPSARNATGDAVIICPGGGYWVLAYDWEGTDIAKYLNSKGIAGIVLKYRLPTSASNIEPRLSPLLDAQRAMRLVRYNAESWKIDPSRVGIMGFSAGGHLASTLSTHFDQGAPDAKDPVDRLSCRPDFSVLVYPVITFIADYQHSGSKEALLGKNPDPELLKYYSNELQVTPQTPPAILIHSSDDQGVPVENSISYFEALRKNNVPASMLIYPYGGHGFALATGRGYLSTWPDRVVEWINGLKTPRDKK
jgi:acetyl esterase/lipase